MDAYALWTVRRRPVQAGARPSASLDPGLRADFAAGMAKKGSTPDGVAWFLADA